MVRTVSDKGSFYGWRKSFRPNRLQNDNEPDDSIQIISTKTVKCLQQKMYSLPASQRELCLHLLSLIILNKKAWIFVVSCLLLFGTTAVNACSNAGVTTVYGVVVPVIHPCNSHVRLIGRGIKCLLFGQNFPNLRSLDVSYNHIENIQTGLFLGMENLSSLTLSHNNLAVIRISNFNGSAIDRLNLDNNQIVVLFEGAFDGLEDTLLYLNLRSNRLWSLSKGVFNNLHDVTVLDISFNDLSVVHRDAFKGMNSLLRLMLEGNKLTTVSGWLPLVTRQLDLSDNRINTTEGLPQDESLDLNLVNNTLNICSQENKDFVKFCIQTAKCRIEFDPEVRCDDGHSNSNIVKYDNTEEQNHPPGRDPSSDSGTRKMCSSFMLVVVLPFLFTFI
ncbi:Leucine-rich repeats and immunoglobulin-like domains protein 2 [Holothuria leucospilota]|uniref:Leucine-rich repeats and immunoglobulin-like domains protein 2 n=1 Tax=Holothuria leucospilota TaxID=206669 RepID=A0A9Q1C6J3_HOLLE|nr:Leucine-rich repeats and immunoglobulin-like domains protein 2 [Holothuria leucospilota]